jgi:hypothetical protein
LGIRLFPSARRGRRRPTSLRAFPDPLRAAPFSFQLLSSAGTPLPINDFGLDPLGAFVHNVTSRYETSRETARSAHFMLSQKHGFLCKYAERQIFL